MQLSNTFFCFRLTAWSLRHQHAHWDCLTNTQIRSNQIKEFHYIAPKKSQSPRLSGLFNLYTQCWCMWRCTGLVGSGPIHCEVNEGGDLDLLSIRACLQPRAAKNLRGGTFQTWTGDMPLSIFVSNPPWGHEPGQVEICPNRRGGQMHLPDLGRLICFTG